VTHNDSGEDIDRVVNLADEHNESKIGVDEVSQDAQAFQTSRFPFKSTDHQESAMSRIEEVAGSTIWDDDGWNSWIIPGETGWIPQDEVLLSKCTDTVEQEDRHEEPGRFGIDHPMDQDCEVSKVHESRGRDLEDHSEVRFCLYQLVH